MSELDAALEAEAESQDAAELRAALRRKDAQIAKLKAKREEVALIVAEAAHDAVLSLPPVKPVPAPKLTSSGRREVALWHLTDWQGSKVTTSYNEAIMRERVLRFCDTAADVTEIQRADHPVPDGVVLLGGDMIEGLFNYPTQPYEIESSLFGQYVFSARLVADVIRRALSVYREITVVTEWGNHGRVGAKRAAVPRSDNADRMVYELARTMLSDSAGALHPRLTWVGSDEDQQQVEIGNYRALLIHGDEFGRNGSVAKTTLEKKVADWKSGSYPWSFRDVYVGHYHRHDESVLPDGAGAVYWTGSPESDNRYARDSMAASGSPSQRLHFIDPRKGRVTAQYKVHLGD